MSGTKCFNKFYINYLIQKYENSKILIKQPGLIKICCPVLFSFTN